MLQHSTGRRRRTRAAIALALVTLLPGAAHAQRVLGIGEDATMLPRGTFRVRTSVEWQRYTEQFGSGGTKEPLGGELNVDALGVSAFPFLAPIQERVAALADDPTFALSLGSTRAALDRTRTTTPISAELGLLRRLTIGATLPYVRTRTEVQLYANPSWAPAGNVGVNPALTLPLAQQRNQQVVAALTQASTNLEARIAACGASPDLPGCSAIAANPTAAAQLVSTTTAFAAAVGELYGTSATTAASFVPLAGSAAQQAIEERIAGFNAALRSFLGTPAAEPDPIAQRPFSASLPIGVPELQTLLTDEAAGISAAPMQLVERSHVGDVELFAKVLLLDTFGTPIGAAPPPGFRARVALTGLARLGTGQSDSPSDFADLGTGDGQTDLEGRIAADLAFGGGFWTSFAARYGVQLADSPMLRVRAASAAPEEATISLRAVDRDLGDYIEIEASPRWVLNGYFAISANYMYRTRAADTYSGASIADLVAGAAPFPLPAELFGAEQTEQRVGLAISYSSLDADARGRARFPFDIWYAHYETIAGSGGVPLASVDQLQFRVYTKLFGR